MQLEKMNLTELDVQEVKNVNGGVFVIPVLAVYGAAGCLASCAITLSLAAGYYNNK